MTSEFNSSWFEPVISFGWKYCQKVTQFSENIHSVVNFFEKIIHPKDAEIIIIIIISIYIIIIDYYYCIFLVVLEGVATFMSTDYSL